MANKIMYVYKGHAYKILREVLVKDQSSREWYKAVEYTRVDIANGDVFVRESKEFYDKFEKVELENSNTNIR